MRRALTLAAVGSTLFAASAEDSKDEVELNFSSIRALNTPATDKDSWSYKGTITVPANVDYVKDVLENGVEVDLSGRRRPESPDSSPDSSRSNSPTLDEVSFDPDECKAIRGGTGVSCKTDGARATVTKVRT